MEIASMDRLMRPPKLDSRSRLEGFSLLEMLMVVTLILIVASIAEEKLFLTPFPQ
jgi:prepilin-type N-terminal cleavage/methylation domain-containing protein